LSPDTTFHLPPREYPPKVPVEPLRIGAPPIVTPPAQHGLMQSLFPVVGGVGMVGFALIYGNTAFLYIAGAMMVLLVAFSIGLRWSQKRSARRKAAADAQRYARHLREQEEELTEAGELQRRASARLYPDVEKIWTGMVQLHGAWERRRHDDDFLRVRLGRGAVPLERPVTLDIGANPLTEYHPESLHEARWMIQRRSTIPNQPVVEDLSEVGVLAVTGHPDSGRAWARSLMVQLAAFRAPHHLRLVTSFDPEDADQWQWGKWLPHQRLERPGEDGAQAPPALTLARSATELEALLEGEVGPRAEQLRRIAESERSGRAGPLEVPTLVVVIDGYRPDHPANSMPAFRELLSRARDLEAILVLLTEARELEPTEIDARVAVAEHGPGSWQRSGPNAPLRSDIALDSADAGMSEAIARSLAPLRLKGWGDGERGLLTSVRLLDVLGLEAVEGFDPQVAQTSRPRSLELRVPVAVQADGELLELDLKQAAEGGMGPHGILVGATGSGKSELLRTLVAGLAARHSPEALSFVLVDYKGGAAFAELSRLPHVAGLITSLQRDLSLVDRMRDALVGEQQRRQRLLVEAGELDDIIAYQARRAVDPELEPMPNLLVIVDEFAELLSARPEFIDLFVSIGRVGRSLGIHLLFSSQRLDEGRLRGLESHLRYRICLRTHSAPESKMVLDTPDAYLLPFLPGLGYLKVDTTTYVQFRAALASAPYREPAESPVKAPAEVRAFDAASSAAWGTADASGPVVASEQSRTELQFVIERLVDRHAEAPAVHQVWLPPLPPVQPLDAALEGQPFWEAEHRPETLSVPLGTVDRPTEQRTDPLALDFTGAGGHLAVVGAPRMGKSTILRTLVASFVWRYTPAEARFYAIDFGGGLLGTLAGAPHVGGVAGKLQREAVQRVVRQLRAEIEDREETFRALGVESMQDIRALRRQAQLPEGIDLPDTFLLVDGWEAFKREFGELELHREVEQLAADGLNFGVHVVVTANRWAEIRPALLDNLGVRLELHLNDAVDSIVSKAAQGSLPADVPGRGITREGLHFQAALPRVDGKAETEGSTTALEVLLAEAAARWRGEPAEPIRLLPRELDPADLPAPSAEGIAIGLEERRLEPVRLDLEGGDPHFLVFGDSGSGKSSLLRLIARGISGLWSPEEAQLVVVDTRRSLVDLAGGDHLLAYAGSQPAVAEAVGEVARIAGERMPSAGVSATALEASQWEGPRIYVLFDDYDLASGPAGSPLAPLVDMLPLGRDIGLHLVLARRVAGSTRAGYEQVFQRVREIGSPGLLLAGERGEGALLAGERASPQPPGRGLLVRRGEPSLLVQTALAGRELPGPSGKSRPATFSGAADREQPSL